MEKCQTFSGFSFLNMRICCFCLSYGIVNEISLDFGLLIRQNKQYEDVRELVIGIFHCFLSFYRPNNEFIIIWYILGGILCVFNVLCGGFFLCDDLYTLCNIMCYVCLPFLDYVMQHSATG